MPKIIDHDLYRKQLLQLCIPIFANHSFASVSMRQIAAELGVSTGTLYHYFESKEDIYIQLIEHMAVDSLILSENSVTERDSLETRLDEFIQFILTFEEQIMQTVLILTDFIRTSKAKRTSYTNQYTIESFNHIEWTAKYLKVEDIDLVSHFLYLIQGVVVQRYMNGYKTDLKQHLELAKSMFLQAYNQNAAK